MTESIFESTGSLKEESKRSLKVKIRPAMKLLTPRERQVIRHLFWHNKTREEVAKILGVNLGTVHNLRRRALKKLEAYFAENLKKASKKVQVLKKNEKFFSSLISNSYERPVA